MSKEANKYNGWTNYETWKTNLEFFDGYPWEDFEDLDMGFPSFGRYLYDMVEECIEDNSSGFANCLARVAIEDVNFDEIGDGIRDTYRKEK